MAITIRFYNRNVGEEGVRVYRSAEPFTIENLPPVYETIAGGLSEYTDTAVTRGQEFHYCFETFRGVDNAFSPVLHARALPIETGPGPQILMPGSTGWLGFYGEVSASELITGDDLASQIGLTAGTAQHSEAGWLKFASEGKTLFVAKKTLRHSVSWDHIHAQGAVFGTREIDLLEDTYKVRLLTGADVDPTPVQRGHNPAGTSTSEWNRLIYNVHSGVHTRADNTTPPGTWPLYSDTDLVVDLDAGRGSYSWCQETDANIPSQRVNCGYTGVSNFNLADASATNAYRGWRPVLELVP